MKNLRKLLSATTVLGLTTVSAVNVVACGNKGNQPKQKTDLNGLKNIVKIEIANAHKKVSDYKNTLITKLKKETGFNNLTPGDVDITKSDGNALQDSDIRAGTLNTKVKARATSQNFTGEKTINVTIKITNILPAYELGLEDSFGKGRQTLTIKTPTQTETQVRYTLPALENKIKASSLLKSNNQARDEISFDFITNILNINPTSGTTYIDAIFNKNVLDTIEGSISGIHPTFTKTSDNKDYAVNSGTFNFQFQDNTGKFLGDKYLIPLKSNSNRGIISNTLKDIVKRFVVSDTDVVTNPNILFVKNGKIPDGAVKGVIINININNSNFSKQFKSLNELTKLNISAQLEERSSGTDWDSNDYLDISYKTQDLNFDANLVITEFKIPK